LERGGGFQKARTVENTGEKIEGTQKSSKAAWENDVGVKGHPKPTLPGVPKHGWPKSEGGNIGGNGVLKSSPVKLKCCKKKIGPTPEGIPDENNHKKGLWVKKGRGKGGLEIPRAGAGSKGVVQRKFET